MTDKTEKAVQDILRRANGNSKTMDDLFELCIAINEDSDDRHRETLDIIQSLTEKFETHCDESNVRDAKIGELDKRLSKCPASIRDAVEQHHHTLHSEHMDKEHSDDRKTWAMWGVFSHLAEWIPYALIIALIAVLVDFLLR